MNRFRAFLQHLFNPLHTYCRLRACGLSKDKALGLSKIWERGAGWLLYQKGGA